MEMVKSDLVPRDDNACGGNVDFNICGQGFPSNRCCAKTSTCLPIYGIQSFTSICCERGNNCASIPPINSTVVSDPLGAVYVSGIPPVLSECNDGFCPPGYDCLGNKVCSMRANATQPQSVLKPTPMMAASHSSRTGLKIGLSVGFVIIILALVLTALWMFRRHFRHIPKPRIADDGTRTPDNIPVSPEKATGKQGSELPHRSKNPETPTHPALRNTSDGHKQVAEV
jgi:hypothetical protein